MSMQKPEKRYPAIDTWVFVPPDQLTDEVGPLSRSPVRSTGILIIESHWWARRRPHHKQKITLVFANLRHFAVEMKEKGFTVEYVVSDQPYRDTLREILPHLGGQIAMMEAASREMRVDLAPLVDSGSIDLLENETWLTTRSDFLGSQSGPPWRMDRFYRGVRKRTGILMENGSPIGGKYSFDTDNRKPWPGDPPAPQPPEFPLDDIKRDVGALVERQFASHPGRVQLSRLPATHADAEAAWKWAVEQALPTFGPFEDAMSSKSPTLFHTLISPLMNLGRVLPRRTITDALEAALPLASLEGFVRQVIGWREFVHHVHRETDGFRRLGGRPTATVPDSGSPFPELDRGANPNVLMADRELPPAFWGAESGLNCLDTVVGEVIETGWSHHITRLMILSNLATLLDASPRQLTDWFWEMYVDAWDWVVEPNVLGMGTFSAGDVMTTKPYVSGAAYINRMSDYCSSCAFNPDRDCPVTNLYWQFLERKQAVLSDNHRLRLPLASLKRRSGHAKAQDKAVFEWLSDVLERGGRADAANVPSKEDITE